MKPILPNKNHFEGIPFDIAGKKQDFEVFSNEPHNSCWKCSDSPCIKLAELVSPETMLIKGSNLPDYNVCPSKSIFKKELGEIEINKESCSGCGLCVVACPVNALVLNPKLIPISEYSELKNIGSNFHSARYERSTSILKKRQKINKDLVHIAIESTSKLLNLDFNGKNVQVFVRNAFTNSGLKAIIRIEGDINDAFELVVESDKAAFPIEIAIGGDTLDSTRRILSGCASLIAKGIVEVFSLKPILIVDELPNSRSEIYRVIEDMHNYLGLDLKIVPLSIFQLLIYLEVSLEEYFTTGLNCSSSEWYWRNLKEVIEANDSDMEELKLTK